MFSTLDDASGYWQLGIDERDRNETSSTSHHGLYIFIKMPIGMKNDSATFQRTMDNILDFVRQQSGLAYLDDIVLFSKSLEDYFK